MQYIAELIAGWSTVSVMMRLILAMVVGMVVGMEREIRNRGAGIKTHVLVCTGAALAMIVGEYVSSRFPGSDSDLTRLGAQVISGVGFLGVGTIVVTGHNEVKGLSTAAGLWACAITGLAAGIGYLQGTLLSLGVILFTFAVLSKIDDNLKKYSKEITIYLEFSGNEGVKNFFREMHRQGVKVMNCNLNRIGKGDKGFSAVAVLELPRHNKRDEILEFIAMDEGIRYFDQL